MGAFEKVQQCDKLIHIVILVANRLLPLSCLPDQNITATLSTVGIVLFFVHSHCASAYVKKKLKWTAIRMRSMSMSWRGERRLWNDAVTDGAGRPSITSVGVIILVRTVALVCATCGSAS